MGSLVAFGGMIPLRTASSYPTTKMHASPYLVLDQKYLYIHRTGFNHMKENTRFLPFHRSVKINKFLPLSSE